MCLSDSLDLSLIETCIEHKIHYAIRRVCTRYEQNSIP
jgi:hypothetical protein